MTEDITNLLVGDNVMYCVGLLFLILLAKSGPTLIKCLLNCSAISALLVYVLLFLTILRGVVWPLVFLFINVPISVHVALNYSYTNQSVCKNKLSY